MRAVTWMAFPVHAVPERVPKHPADDPVVDVLAVHEAAELVVGPRGRAGQAVDAEDLAVHGRLHHLARRKGRLHRHVVPALGHEIVAALAQPGTTLHGLALGGEVRQYAAHGWAGGPFHSRLSP